MASPIENLEGDTPISVYAEVAAEFGLPAWVMMVPGTTRDMFEDDAAKAKRLVKLVEDHLACPESWRKNIEDLTAGFADINRGRTAAVT
jgi:hypothetical protein